MCEIDWNAFSGMLIGIGTIMMGIGALYAIPKRIYDKKISDELLKSYRLSFKALFREWEASSEGIVFDYPKDKKQYARALQLRNPWLNEEQVLEMMDDLKKNNYI